MGEDKFRIPAPPKPLNQYGYSFKYITKSPGEVDVQNLVGIDSAVTNLHVFPCDFFLLTWAYPFVRATCHIFSRF